MWVVNQSYPKTIQKEFACLEQVFSLQSKDRISSHSLSEVIKVTIDNQSFYVKRYFCGGRRVFQYEMSLNEGSCF